MNGPLASWYKHIRAQPCLRCGRPGPSEVAHVCAFPSRKVSGFMPRRKGIASYSAVPLCPECHRYAPTSIHAVGENAFFEALGKPEGYVFGYLARELATWASGEAA